MHLSRHAVIYQTEDQQVKHKGFEYLNDAEEFAEKVQKEGRVAKVLTENEASLNRLKKKAVEKQ